MQGFRVFVLVIWVILLAVTWRALAEMGGMAGGNVFLADFAHPWRAQFNTDLSLHLLLFAVWAFWREHSKRVGGACALLCVLGGLFTFLYLFASVLRSQGDVRALLLGSHA
jgi:hypothetical protein